MGIALWIDPEAPDPPPADFTYPRHTHWVHWWIQGEGGGGRGVPPSFLYHPAMHVNYLPLWWTIYVFVYDPFGSVPPLDPRPAHISAPVIALIYFTWAPMRTTSYTTTNPPNWRDSSLWTIWQSLLSAILNWKLATTDSLVLSLKTIFPHPHSFWPATPAPGAVQQQLPPSQPGDKHIVLFQ